MSEMSMGEYEASFYGPEAPDDWDTVVIKRPSRSEFLEILKRVRRKYLLQALWMIKRGIDETFVIRYLQEKADAN